jgi:hypothetical protein
MQCGICLKKFDIGPRIRAHLTKEHEISTVEEQNQYIMDNRKELYLAMPAPNVYRGPKGKRTNTVKNLVCDICGYSTGRKNELKIHMNIHEGIFYTCDICGASTNRKLALATHMKSVHLCQRNYKCDQCDKSYTAWVGLKYHKLAAHTNERPFKCHLCPATYKTKYILEKHISTTHFGIKRFHCKPCGKSYTVAESRMKHNRSVHGVNSNKIPLNDME